MKRSFAAMVLTLLILGSSLFASQGRFTGTVTDDMCAHKHTMMSGKPDSDCVRACVKAGRKYALVVGDKLYKLQGHDAESDRFAAKRVQVTGDLAGDVIQVATVELAR